MSNEYDINKMDGEERKRMIESMSDDLKQMKSKIASLELVWESTKNRNQNRLGKYINDHSSGDQDHTSEHMKQSGVERRKLMHDKEVMSSIFSSEPKIISQSFHSRSNNNKTLNNIPRRNSISDIDNLWSLYQGQESFTRRLSTSSKPEDCYGFHTRNIKTREKLRGIIQRVEKLSQPKPKSLGKTIDKTEISKK